MYVDRNNFIQSLKAYKANGQWDEALALLNMLPDCNSIEVLYEKAIALQQLSRHEEAISTFSAVAKEAPLYPPVHFGIGLSQHCLGRYEDAEDAYRRAIRHNPQFWEAYNNLGIVLQKLSRYDAALECHNQAIRICGDAADLYNSCGNCLEALGREDEALAAFETTIELDSQHYEAINNKAILLQRFHRYDEALQLYNQSIELAASSGVEFNKALFNRGILQLQLGNWTEGLTGYEYRLKLSGFEPIGKYPAWDGEHAETLYVRAEQGFGDTFQFARYLPMLRPYADCIIFECQFGMRELIEQSHLCDEVIEREPSGRILPAPPNLPVIHLSSLLYFLYRQNNCSGIDVLDSSIPYLSVPDHYLRLWERKIESLASNDCFRIGIVWRGRMLETAGRQRACHLHEIASVISNRTGASLRSSVLPNIRIFSLQKDMIEEEAAYKDIEFLGGGLNDFSDTSAAIMQMDLIITIDTCISHLAGALGKTVWTILPYSADWRWLIDRTDSPFYPEMKLFRQKRHNDWTDVMHAIKEELSLGVLERITHHIAA